MRVDILDNWSDLDRIAGEWNALLRRSRADSVFLTHEWIDAWRETVAESVAPLVVTVRTPGGELVGAAAFYASALRLGGVVGYRALRVMGDYPTSGEYPDWIVDRAHEAQATRAIAETLRDASDRWDCLWLPSVAGWTGARERLEAACRAAGFHCHVRERQFSAFELPATYDQYVSALSANARSMLRRRTKAIVGDGGAVLEQCASEAEREAMLDALFDLHARRWNAAGEEGSFRRRPRQAVFYRHFTRRALAQGWLRLYGLRIDGELRAVQLGYVYGGTFHQVQEGFDTEAPAGIGTVLRGLMIERCIAEGIRRYDFLGGVSEHKRRWLAEPRVGFDLFIGRRGIKNRLLFAGNVWPTGRFLRPERDLAA